MIKITTSENIIAKISFLKQQKKKVYTNSNIIFTKFPFKKWSVYESEKSLLIIIVEKQIIRCTFYTIDFEDLKKIIINLKGDLVIEVVSKDKDNMKKEIEEMGLKRIVIQKRDSSKDVSDVFKPNSSIINYYNKSIGSIATDLDVEQINDMLWNTFDIKSSHLKSKEKLIEQIENNEFYIYKDENNKIEMLIQYKFSPKCFYFNQVINIGEKNLFHALTLNLLKKYCAQGGKYAYAWINDGNIASFKYFEKYTLVEDGVYNSIYSS